MISGSDLGRLRRRAGRTQRWVAEAVGVSATAVSAYERGRREPGIETATRIIVALGYRIELVPLLDPEVQASRLEQVLTLAEALPYRPAPLATARR